MFMEKPVRQREDTKCNKDINHLPSILTRAPISRDRKQRPSNINNAAKKTEMKEEDNVLKFVHLRAVYVPVYLFKVISIHML